VHNEDVELESMKLRKNTFFWTWLFLSAVVILVLGSVAHPADTPKIINLAYSAPSPGAYTGYWIALERRLFQKHGLTPGKLVYISGASVAMASLLSGEIDVVFLQATAPMNIQAGGGDASIFGATTNILPYYIFLRRGLNNIKDIEGRRAAVSRIGSGSHAGLLALFKQFGVDAEKVTFVAAGDLATRVGAFLSGSVDLVGLSPPYHLPLLDQGYEIKTNLLDQRVPWAQVIIAGRRSWLEKNRESAKAMLRAIAEGSYYGLSHRQETETIWKKYVPSSDPRAMEESWTYFRKAFVPDLRPDVTGIKNVRDFSVSPGNPKAAAIPPEKYIFWPALDDLQQEKFFTTLASKYGVSGR
jgi:ABC-type nitrate/sulfonate/bicarbonate transport system substrate-binding protein